MLSQDGNRKLRRAIRTSTSGSTSVENAVVILHITAWECHKYQKYLGVATPKQPVPEEATRALQLSRYALYLLNHRPEFFPSICVQAVYEKARRDACATGRAGEKLQELPLTDAEDQPVRESEEALEALAMARDDFWLAGQHVARILRDRPPAEKWEVLAGVFTDLLITIARTSVPSVHIQLLAGGGESFTKIWLMLHQLEFRLADPCCPCPEHAQQGVSAVENRREQVQDNGMESFQSIQNGMEQCQNNQVNLAEDPEEGEEEPLLHDEGEEC